MVSVSTITCGEIQQILFHIQTELLVLRYHEGAERSTVLYTLALSCRMHKLDFFQYIKAVLEKTSECQPNTPLSKYRELLPDKF